MPPFRDFPLRPTDEENICDHSLDVFFYGIYQDFALLREYGVSPQKHCNARVDGYRLRIGEQATLLRDELAASWGILATLSIRDILSLYRRDDTRDYIAIDVAPVTPDGKVRQAIAFILRTPPGPAEENPRYRDALRSLMAHRNLPVTQLDHVDARPTASLDVQFSWLFAEVVPTDFTRAICQCGTSVAIGRSSDPDRLLALLLAYGFLEQLIQRASPGVHAVFKRQFTGPKLAAHQGDETFWPGFLLEWQGHRLERPDLPRIQALLNAVLTEGVGWIARQPGIDVRALARDLRNSLRQAVPNGTIALDSEQILAGCR